MGNTRKRAKNSWTLTWELPPDPATGERRQGYETVRGTKREARRILVEREASVAKGELVRPSRQKKWLRKSEQGDKWNRCLIEGMIVLSETGARDEQTTPP